MSYLLPHLRTGWAVDQAIINEEERVVCLRFGHDHDVTCMQMDEVLAGIAEEVKNFCAIYVVDVSEVRLLQLLVGVFVWRVSMLLTYDAHMSERGQLREKNDN